MSASNKKKLRKEQESAKLTEKQITAQKEAKKLNYYTIGFVAVLVVLLVIAITVGVTQAITASGIREKRTVALTVGDHEINNTQMNYFYMDAVNNFYTQYGGYATMFGLDVTKPLDQQITNEETGTTWADDFLDTAKQTAVSAYAIKDAADAAGFTLSEEDYAAIENQNSTLDVYAMLYGYSDGEAYLKAMYGTSANKESFTEYTTLRTLADKYSAYYSDSLTYDDAALREAEKDNYDTYSSYSYHTYYLSTNNFLTGGTADAEGNITYTEEEKAAAVTAAKEAADTLMAAGADSVEAFDKAIDALSINEGKDASSTAYEDTLYTNVSSTYADWITDSSRKEGDMEVFESSTTSTLEDGTEEKTVNGYYVVYYVDTNDNTFALKNVRHILVNFTHDETEDHDHSEATYTDAEKAAAKATAEEILAQWKAGEATEESFATMANEKSADGDGTTGGLYENVYPGQMVPTFNDWTYDAARKSGDTGIVESTYGYHVMYFVGDSETNYRDHQITTELRQNDMEAWYAEINDSMTTVEGDMKYINKGIVLNRAG